MLFNSEPFLFYFLPIVCLGYQFMARFGRRSVIGWLAFASIVFYSWWNWHFVFVLAGSLLLNFSVSRLIARSDSPGRKKLFMVAGIVLDLAILFWFKYLFVLLHFLQSQRWIHGHWGEVALPLGISFFTFTQIGYLVDLSQGEADPQNFIEYALFVTFFPHLIAGPIIHHKEMMPQFLEKKDPRLNMSDMLTGISWFVLGLAKKCILADYFAPSANAAFASTTALGARAAWLGVLTYSLQLYFDFSGYSDMAIGLARMFSIRFPMNFNSPYKSLNVIDFWQRWHMTLTRYLTLYLYNPISLAVNRRRLRAKKKISQRAARTIPGFLSMIAWPTLITMFLVGIWHGAGSQFMIFGLLHGFYLTVNHAWRLLRRDASRDQSTGLKRVASVLLTYVCVLVGQVFFRASSTGSALHFLAGMAGMHRTALQSQTSAKLWLITAAGFFIVWFLPNTQQILGEMAESIDSRVWAWMAWRPNWQWSITLGMLLFVAILFFRDAATFLYFQF